MSKNYDLYLNYERKINNWRRRILGYEKMKRDLQRQIQILKNKNKKQKEVIDKAINDLSIILEIVREQPLGSDCWIIDRLEANKKILNEVSE